ncbi:ferritin-like domain-containing protein [Luteolibacter luteus]|uniref:Ferritin-like domain-containing protein n=1 Tax=Luteolibacter luteus TaxID=2728835 RepID=A0A858RHI7_9BACT|nr:ferritin-like domain-containing protein [Luteolibacter luteus]QJE96014.1 ferritin-like domain-containing protein [Luteolibacter luteus]
MNRRNLAWKLGWYRQSELDGALLLGRMVGQTEDAYMIERLTRHCAEEAEHSRLWEEVIRELDLPHITIRRSFQSFYMRHTAPPASLLEVLCFTQIFERRVHKRFIAEAADPATPEAARRAFLKMIEDEKDHLGWVAHWLKDQPGALACLTRFQTADQAVADELLPYEHRIHDIPDLGKESLAAARQLHPAHG